LGNHIICVPKPAGHPTPKEEKEPRAGAAAAFSVKEERATGQVAGACVSDVRGLALLLEAKYKLHSTREVVLKNRQHGPEKNDNTPMTTTYKRARNR
jgi:hypothetical protein